MVSGAVALLWLAIILALAYILVGRFGTSPILALLGCALVYGLCIGLPQDAVALGVMDGFGGWLGTFGLAIAITSVTATLLEKSGALAAIGQWATHKVEAKSAQRGHFTKLAAILGFIIAVPSPGEFGYFLFLPFVEDLTDESRVDRTRFILAYAAGIFAASSLVMPTVAALSSARAFAASLGQTLFVGLIAAAVALVSGLWWISRKNPSAVVQKDVAKDENYQTGAQIEIQTGAPSIRRPLVPIVLPFVLLVLKMIADLPARPFGSGWVYGWIAFCGHPVVAACLGLAFALLLFRKRIVEGKTSSNPAIAECVEEAIVRVTPILIVAALAASFSQIVKAGPLVDFFSRIVPTTSIAGRFGALFLCFALAAAFKSIQGSSLIAVVLASGAMAAVPQAVKLNPALAVAAVGAGSLVASHINDPLYWILQRILGLSTKDMARSWTAATAIEGTSAFLAVCVMALFIH